jgi:hypothetical protein
LGPIWGPFDVHFVAGNGGSGIYLGPIGQRPGGGGGGDANPITTQARLILNKRLANFVSSNCDKVFNNVIESYTTKSFSSTIDKTDFYQVRNASHGNLTQDQVVNNGVKTTLNNSVPYGTDAVTIWGPNTTAVLLGANYFSNTDSMFQQNTLLHELLHAYTHWNDKEIFDAFKHYGLKQMNPGTGDITEWLKNDCKRSN